MAAEDWHVNGIKSYMTAEKEVVSSLTLRTLSLSGRQGDP